MKRRSVIVRQTSTRFQKTFQYTKAVFVILGPILFIAWLIHQPITQIQTITCTTDIDVCDGQTLAKLAEYKHHSIFNLKIRNIEQSLSENPQFESVSVNVKFPNTLIVNIVLQKNTFAVGVIKTQLLADPLPSISTSSATPSAQPHPINQELTFLDQTPESFWSLTQNGHLLNTEKQDTHILILTTNDLPPQDKLTSFYQLCRELTQNAINLDKIWYTNRWVGVKLKTGPLVVFDITKDPLKSVTTLQQILAQATMDLTHTVIDLRFSKPVITNNP